MIAKIIAGLFLGALLYIPLVAVFIMGTDRTVMDGIIAVTVTWVVLFGLATGVVWSLHTLFGS